MSTPALLEKGSPGSGAVAGSGGSGDRRYAGEESVTLEELRIDSGSGAGADKKVCLVISSYSQWILYSPT